MSNHPTHTRCAGDVATPETESRPPGERPALVFCPCTAATLSSNKKFRVTESAFAPCLPTVLASARRFRDARPFLAPPDTWSPKTKLRSIKTTRRPTFPRSPRHVVPFLLWPDDACAQTQPACPIQPVCTAGPSTPDHSSVVNRSIERLCGTIPPCLRPAVLGKMYRGSYCES
jgi:hypothetical protein